MRDAPWSNRAILGASTFFLALVATYAFLRAKDVLFASEENPATILYVYGGHIAMFWRAAVGAYVGGAVGLLVLFLARTREAAVTRALAAALPWVAGFAVLQALILP